MGESEFASVNSSACQRNLLRLTNFFSEVSIMCYQDNESKKRAALSLSSTDKFRK